MIYQIDWLEAKKTTTGKDVLNVTLKDDKGVINDKVSIWGDFPNFANLRPGDSVNGDIVVNAKGYKTLYPIRTNVYQKTGGSGVKAAQERKAEMIEKAQERKNESIAFFNATNSAIELVTKQYDGIGGRPEKDIMENIVFWRDWFLSEWRKYEASEGNDKHNAF